MKKLTVIGHSSVRAQLMRSLMALGVVEIVDQEARLAESEWKDLVRSDKVEGAVSRYESWVSRTAQVVEALEKYGTGKKPMFRTREPIAFNEFETPLAVRQDMERKGEVLEGHLRKLNELQAAQNKLEASRMALLPWNDFDLPLELKETREVEVLLGGIPATASPDLFKQALAGALDQYTVEVVTGDSEQYYIALLVRKSVRNDLDEILKNFGFNRIQFVDLKGTAADNIKAIDGKLAAIETDRQVAIDAIRSMEGEKRNFQLLHDYLALRKEQALVRERLLVTKQTFYLDGWMPAAAAGKVEELLRAHDCYFTMRDPDKGEETPVLLLNGKAAGPFEAITRLYALPDSRGVDATPFFAIFYAIFFGMMLSDAAYGVILTVATFLILRKFKLEGMAGRLMKMFFYCGISTIVWGILFGSYFGDLVTVVAKTFFNADVTIPALWFMPMADPMKLLMFSFILGGIHIFLGMALDGWMSIKDGRPWDAVFDIGLWYLLLVGIVLLLGGISPLIGKWMSIAGAVGILITGGRHNKGLGRFTGGLSSLYGITGYLSDVLSYSRLLALGLATGVIASVVNTMGSLAGGGITGLLLMIFAFFVGHSYNIAINALGSFVHSCRLQYVEFFGKFYKSGGEAFEPFREKTKYIEIVREDH